MKITTKLLLKNDNRVKKMLQFIRIQKVNEGVNRLV